MGSHVYIVDARRGHFGDAQRVQDGEEADESLVGMNAPSALAQRRKSWRCSVIATAAPMIPGLRPIAISAVGSKRTSLFRPDLVQFFAGTGRGVHRADQGACGKEEHLGME